MCQRKGIDRILAEEPLPALAYADGIDHKRELAPLQSGFDRFNDFGGEQHTGLGRGDGEAFPDRFELKSHKARFRAWIPATPTPFCAVRAVMTLIPNPPITVMVLRSA